MSECDILSNSNVVFCHVATNDGRQWSGWHVDVNSCWSCISSDHVAVTEFVILVTLMWLHASAIIRCLRHYFLCSPSLHPSMHPESFWTRHFINRFREFHQIHYFGAIGNKSELIRFWGQRSKLKVETRPDVVKKRQRHMHQHLSVNFHLV